MDNVLVLKTKIDTKDFTRQIADVEERIKGLSNALATAKPGDDVREMEIELEKLNNQLTTLYKKQNDINNQGFKKAHQAVESINHGVQKVGKSIFRWGLTLIGVRSAMTLIRGAMSTLSQYDETLAKNMEYIRYVLAMLLKPLIEYIVDLIFKLLQYINYIANAWFGINLFANASAESMEKTTKNAQKLAKNMEKARKDLLGFDKINKLNAQQSSSSSTTGGTPSVDLSKMLGDNQVPEWLRWIADNGEWLQNLLLGIAGALLAIKLGASGIQALGIGFALLGLQDLIKDFPKYFDELDSSLENNGTEWEDFGKILLDIGLVVVGIGIAFLNLPIIVAGVILLLLGLVLTFYNEITTEIDNIKRDIETSIIDVESKFGFFLNALTGIFSIIGFIIEDTFTGTFLPIKQFADGVLLLFKGKVAGGLENIFFAVGNIIIGTLNKVIDGVNILITPLRSLIQTMGAVGAFFSGKAPPSMKDIKIPNIPYLKNKGTSNSIISQPSSSSYIGSTGYLVSGIASSIASSTLGNQNKYQDLVDKVLKNFKIDITNELDGRVLSKKMYQFDSEDIFARNGG